jgi:predicted phage-related endonuclease
MSDFTPATRNSAIWSGDSRRVAMGKANEVILTKQNKLPIPDLSAIEAVQMGHVMEPVIANLAQNKLKVELKKIEESLTHPKEAWFKSHFDFVGTENGQTILVECKNYGSHQRNKFDDVANTIPNADMAQLVHEAAVFGNTRIYLAVLFGGQEFVMFHYDITDQQKTELIQQMAKVWAHVKTGTTLPLEDLEQVKLLYPQDTSGTVKTASMSVEEACRALRHLKDEIKLLEGREEQLQTLVAGFMETASSLQSIDGSVLATWKAAKASNKFDAKLFEQSMPDIYKSFIREVPGSRRFLLK